MKADQGLASRPLAWLDRRREWQRRALGFLGGALSALTLSPVYAFPLLFLSFPIFFLIVRASTRPVSAFTAGWWFGFGFFAVGLYWIGIAFLVNEDVSNLAAPFAVGALSGALAFFTGFAALAFHLVRNLLARRGMALNLAGEILLFILAWSLFEWLRGHIFTGFPWNLIGYAFAGWAPLMQGAAYVGVYGLGAILLFLALTPVMLLAGQGTVARLAAPVVAGLVLAGMIAGGVNRLPAGDAPVTDTEIRVVQANIDQRDKWKHNKIGDNFIRFLNLSSLPRRRPADLIIWPETAVAYFLEREPSRRYLMADVMPPGSYIVTGALRIHRGPDGVLKLWNSMHAVDDRGGVAATYDKVHLVPFGEYLPFRAVLERLGFSQFVPSAVDFTPGDGFSTIALGGLPAFSPLICYEIIFPGAVARDDRPPAWLLNLTNDAWYGISSGPYQHLVTAQMRAVEEGVPVVRAAGTGISAVIDPYGRVVDQVGLARAGVIDARLPDKVESRTIYARIGDWSYGSLLFLFALLMLSGLCRRRLSPVS